MMVMKLKEGYEMRSGRKACGFDGFRNCESIGIEDREMQKVQKRGSRPVGADD
jgi:hypothetical protein